MGNSESEPVQNNFLVKSIIKANGLSSSGQREFKVIGFEKLSNLPKEIFVEDTIKNQFECPICFGILCDPVALNPCGHIYCKDCWEQCLSSQPRRACAICRKPVSSILDQLSQIKTMIYEAKVLCATTVLNQSSCKWNGKFDNLQRHLQNECEYVELQCFCGKKINRKSLFDPQVECDCANEQCAYCSKVLKSRFMDAHQKDCQEEVIIHECGASIKRKNYNDHVHKDCKQQFIHCRYKEYGCSFKHTEVQMSLHYSNNENFHQNLIKQYTEKLKAENLKAVEEKEVLLEIKAHELEECRKNLENEIDACKAKAARESIEKDKVIERLSMECAALKVRDEKSKKACCDIF